MPFSTWITVKVSWMVTLLSLLLPNEPSLNTSARETLFRFLSSFSSNLSTAFLPLQSEIPIGSGPVTSQTYILLRSLLLTHSSHIGLLAIPLTYQIHSCLRVFTQNVPSFWNALPPESIIFTPSFPSSLWANGTFSVRLDHDHSTCLAPPHLPLPCLNFLHSTYYFLID